MLRTTGPFTKIVFNFPHVGGLSTDVNRQVRHNQELLVGFFKAAKDLLSSPSKPARVALQSEAYESDDEYASDDVNQPSHSDPGAVHGQILVTIFEGEPYTLWNVRDLARHSGLKVVESFKFPWSAYPGYQHARTIGDITTGKDRSEDDKRRGAWRGEEREARCYVLENKDVITSPAHGRASKRKRKEEDDIGD
jgi:25S rRNA (uracil2634-N3)-methyltransferase